MNIRYFITYNGCTDEELCLKWRCDMATIRRWKKQGAPLLDDRLMFQWLTRYLVTKGVLKIYNKDIASALAQTPQSTTKTEPPKDE
jgi:hypothetical protein